jgi:ArsR family transcriptional regulator
LTDRRARSNVETMPHKTPLADAELVRALRALGDARRFEIVRRIAEAGEMSCGQIGEHFDVSQPTMSHHLKILVDAGLLLTRGEGKHHFVRVNRELLRALGASLPARFGR